MNETTALSVVMMPRDSNVYGTIFGGIILSYIDQAGFIEARRHGVHRWVTASIDRVDFERPVYVGDVVRFITTTKNAGRSSITVSVSVIAERFDTSDQVEVTNAVLTMVSIDEHGNTIPFDTPPTISSRDEE